MIKFKILNLLTGETFYKYFDDLFSARKFNIRCKYSTKLRVIEISGIYSYEDLCYVDGD